MRGEERDWPHKPASSLLSPPLACRRAFTLHSFARLLQKGAQKRVGQTLTTGVGDAAELRFKLPPRPHDEPKSKARPFIKSQVGRVIFRKADTHA